jgi:hypothetical protein
MNHNAKISNVAFCGTPLPWIIRNDSSATKHVYAAAWHQLEYDAEHHGFR